MNTVIIVAGGSGTRMGTAVPKQFLPLRGEPVLMHTLRRFYDYSHSLRIILVLPADQQERWARLCRTHRFSVPHIVATGGATRFHSVKNGLGQVPDTEEGVVAVHDGVRPFVNTAVIAACFEAAQAHGAAIPVVPVVESLRHVSGHNVPRADYRMVQTPQAFSTQLLKAAFRQPYRDTFTDDASVVEAYGHPVTMVEGNRENIKITSPIDLIVAEELLKRA